MWSVKIALLSIMMYLGYYYSSQPIDSGVNYENVCLEQDDLINAKLGFTLFQNKIPHFFLELKNPNKSDVHSTISWFGSHLDWNPTPGHIRSPDPFASEGVILPVNFELSCQHIHSHQLEQYHLLAMAGFTKIGNCFYWCAKVLSHFTDYSFQW